MDCAEVLDALAAERALTGPEAAAHLAACSDCAALARDAAGWTGELRRAAGPAPVDLVALQAGLSARLAGERGPLGWLRSRPAWQRALLLLAITPACPAAIALLKGFPLRADLPHHWLPRFVLEAGLLGLVLLTAVWTALRPVHRPALRPGAALAAVLLATLLAAGLALLPAAHSHGIDEPAGTCLVYGLQFGLPLAICALLLSRLVTWPVVALAGLAAGVLGDLVLHLLCPDPRPLHLLLGHASVVATWAGVVLLLGLLRQLRARPA